jgi:hypothetical protein
MTAPAVRIRWKHREWPQLEPGPGNLGRTPKVPSRESGDAVTGRQAARWQRSVRGRGPSSWCEGGLLASRGHFGAAAMSSQGKEDGVNRSERLARGWRGLLICPACLDLFHEGGRGRALAQQCRCRPRGRTWPGLDFNEWARLCDCCVGELLTSGWRFSVWFCDECKPRVWELNKRHGYAVVPVGRHSLMNGVFLSGSDAVAEVDGIVPDRRRPCRPSRSRR